MKINNAALVTYISHEAPRKNKAGSFLSRLLEKATRYEKLVNKIDPTNE